MRNSTFHQTGNLGSARQPGPLGRDASLTGLLPAHDTWAAAPGPLGRDLSDAPLLGGVHASQAPSASGPKKAAFTKIDRAEFLQTLRERVQDSSKIAQRGSSLCGPASLMYLMGKYRPGDYAKFVLDLYENGEARLDELKIKPGTDCKNFNPTNRMAGADWVALASIRDSENHVFDYDEDTDQFAGISLPSHVAGWLKKTSFSDIRNETNLYITKGEDNLREAASLYNAGFEVCLLVNASGIDTEPSNRGTLGQVFTLPNHWVVMTSPMQLSAQAVRFTIFTWGHGKWQVPYGTGTTMTMKQWLQNYYGYVACKP